MKKKKKKLLTKNSPDPDGFRANSTNLIPILHKLLNNRKENFSFFEASITLIPNPKISQKNIQTNIS